MADVYVARKRLRVGNKIYMPGDEVPEANGWWHLRTYVHNGSLALVCTSVDYAVGHDQRTPISTGGGGGGGGPSLQDGHDLGTPDRRDWRVDRRNWYGEMAGWGKSGDGGGTPDDQMPVIDTCDPTSYVIGNESMGAWDTDFTITGSHLLGCTVELADDRYTTMSAGADYTTQTDTTISGTIHAKAADQQSFDRLPVQGYLIANKVNVGWGGNIVMLTRPM